MAFGPAELPARAGSFVEGSWDEMVSGEARRGTPTKGATSIFHRPNLPDRRQWWQEFSGPRAGWSDLHRYGAPDCGRFQFSRIRWLPPAGSLQDGNASFRKELRVTRSVKKHEQTPDYL